MKRLLLPLLFVAQLAAAAVLQPGEPLPAIALQDQNDKPLAIARDTKLVFFAFEMGGSRLMAKALGKLPPTALRDKGAVYLADISAMPAIFTTIIALPRLQKMPYPVGLITDEKHAASVPRKPGAVTVLTVDAGKVSAVEFARDPQQISRHLK